MSPEPSSRARSGRPRPVPVRAFQDACVLHPTGPWVPPYVWRYSRESVCGTSQNCRNGERLLTPRLTPGCQTRWITPSSRSSKTALPPSINAGFNLRTPSPDFPWDVLHARRKHKRKPADGDWQAFRVLMIQVLDIECATASTSIGGIVSGPSRRCAIRGRSVGLQLLSEYIHDYLENRIKPGACIRLLEVCKCWGAACAFVRLGRSVGK